MAKRSGRLVKLYLYKAEHELTVSTTSGENFTLRIGDETTGNIADTASAANIETAIVALTRFAAADVDVSGASSPYTIKFQGDYAFSGIAVEVASAHASVTVSVARKFPSTHATISEVNGFYTMGAESNLDKSFDLETQDVTNKNSDGWKESVGHVRSVSLNPTHFFLTEAQYEAVKNQFEESLPIILCDVDPQEDTGVQNQNYGVYNINNLSETSAQNAVVEFTANFELTGAPVEVKAT